MVAAISRLASLLKQATAGDVPLPAAKPEPTKTALIKTLVTPPTLLSVEPMPSLAPPLIVPARSAAVQKEASSQIIEAYRAALDLGDTGPAPTNSRSSMTSGVAPEVETDPRPLSGQPAGRDDTLSSIRALPIPTYALALPLSAAARQAQVDEAAVRPSRPAQERATHEKSREILVETTVNTRTIAFGLAAFALLLLVVLLVF